MIPYLFLLGFPAFFTILARNVRIRNMVIENSDLVIASFFLTFFFILAFRSDACGNDTKGYVISFNLARVTGWDSIFNSDFEFGYTLFEKFFSKILPSSQWFLVLTSFLSVFPLWFFYHKEVDIPFFSVVLFVVIAPFSMYFSGIRQVLAMALAIPAWYCSKYNKFILFAIVVTVAVFFHSSAFIIVALYPLYHLRFTIKWLWFVIPFISIVFIFNKQIFGFLVNVFYDKYSDTFAQTGAYNMLILLILFAVFAFLIPNESELDKDTIALRNILLFSVMLQCFAPVHFLAMRMNYYYLIFIPVLIPKILMKYSFRYQKLTEVLLLVLSITFVVYFYFNLLRNLSINIYPYQPFWS